MSRTQQRRLSKRVQGGSRVAPGPRRLLEKSLANGKLAAVVLLGASLWGLFYALSSPRFQVRSIRVSNASLQSPEEVAALSGVRGASLWTLEPGQIVANLKRSSYIENAGVTLALPDQLHITVVERQPAIRWSVQGTEYLVDENALVLGPAEGPLENSLVVVDTFRATLSPGEKLDADALALARALALRLPEEAHLTPRRIEWDIFYGILVITENEQKVAFGRKDDTKVSLDEKIATLRSVIDQGMAFQFLDLRPGVPYLVEPTPPPPPEGESE